MQFISFVIHNVHKFTVKRVETDKPEKVFISRNLSLDILLFADDVILFANSEDDLQRSIHQFQLIAEKFSIKISIDKTKVMDFKGKEHIHSKFCVYDKHTEQVSSFKYLSYNIS
jgi:hypothetical protein